MTATPATPGDPLRIVIADDQASVREGLVLLLGGLPDIDVVGAAADGEQALALVAEHHPDAILLDLHMPVLDGIGATRRLAAEHPGVAVVVLTTYADDGTVLEALRAGARSYLTKDADRTDISRGLHAAVRGLSVLGPQVQAALLAAATVPPATAPDAGPGTREPASREPATREPAASAAPPPDGLTQQHGDRRPPVPQQPHRQDPHQPDLRQDRLQGPRRRHRLRPPPQHRPSRRALAFRPKILAAYSQVRAVPEARGDPAARPGRHRFDHQRRDLRVLTTGHSLPSDGDSH
jgi:DNA-binding NarL/FixJ family response regulator